MNEIGYANNVFNTTPNVTSVNEIHLKAMLNNDYYIDLLTIFNNIDVDDNIIFLQLHSEQSYPVFKINKNILNYNNMAWISKWCKASKFEGKMDVGDDTVFTKLIVKIRLPDMYTNQYNNVFDTNIRYFTIELQPKNATIYIRFYIKNEAHMTVEQFKEIMYYTNEFINRCSNMSIYMIPIEYIHNGNVNTQRFLKMFSDVDSETTINFYSMINFINISIQNYWDIFNNGYNIHRSLDTMYILLEWLYNNIQINGNMFNILLASDQIINNQIPLIYIFNKNYITKNKDIIVKTIIKFLKKDRVSYNSYRELIEKSIIMKYIIQIYPVIFAEVDRLYSELMKKTTLTMNTYLKPETESQIIQKISNLFGVTINIGLNNINVLGILNTDMMYMIEKALQIIVEEFIKYYMDPNTKPEYTRATKLNNDMQTQEIFNDDLYEEIDDNFEIDESLLDKVLEEEIDEQVEKTYVEQVNENPNKYFIDPKFFEVYDKYTGSDIEELKTVKNAFLEFEREIMANEIDTLRKKGKAKIQNALTRLQRFDNDIAMNTGFAAECQSDKKPIIITSDEIEKLRNQLNSNKGRLTPYGEYIRFIFENAKKYDNPYYYYICCMIYDFHERKIMNPYCTYAKMNVQLESVYYIPFSTANDLFITEKWYPSGDSYINRYDESKIINQNGKLYYPDPSNNNNYVEMIKIFPNISRFHCIDFNASKNYVALPYKFIPDIVKKNGLPCCFSKTQVIPNNVSNYNNSLNANNETYREYKLTSYNDFFNLINSRSISFDGVNRLIQLPQDINILFNNKSKYGYKYMKNEWCRRLVFQGYFMSVFDFLIRNNAVTMTHSNNPKMPIYLLPRNPLIFYMINGFTDTMFSTMRNGLLRYMFKSKNEFIQYCLDNYFSINEELMWEWISDVFDINIFIIRKINKQITKDKIIPEQYVFEFPQGYDLDKLYSHSKSMFIYKYINMKSEVIYDLIDKVTIPDRAGSVNIYDFNPFIPSNFSFVQTIIQTLKNTNNQVFFDTNSNNFTPTAEDFINNVNLEIVGQTRTKNLEYTNNIIFKLSNGQTVIMPVYPITLLPDNIPVVNNIKFPSYTRKTLLNIIDEINKHQNTGFDWYYPRAVITNNNSMVGYIFDKNIHVYFRPIYYKNGITVNSIKDPTIQIVKQFFRSNNSITAFENRSPADEERETYIKNKNLIKSIIFSIEYMLSNAIDMNDTQYLMNLFSYDSNEYWNQLGEELYDFVEDFVNAYTILDPNKRYNINVSNMDMSNIITNKDDNLVTTYKGSNIKNCYTSTNAVDCNNISVCRWNNQQNLCMVCMNSQEIKNSVINYIVNELLSSFNTIRYKIMYGASFSTEPKNIQNYQPEKQFVVNASNPSGAIDTLNNIIRGEQISRLAENMKIVYMLTNNFNDIQKDQINVILRSLTNEINPEVLYHIQLPCMNNLYMVNMFNNANDFWFTAMLQTAQRSNIVTIPDFRKALSNILEKHKYIRTGGNSGRYIYFSRLIANYYNRYMKSINKPLPPKNNKYETVFDQIIDIFRSDNYMPSYIDFAAIMMAPWNDYNIAIIHYPYFNEFSKQTLYIAEYQYYVYDYDSSTQYQKYKTMRYNELPPNIKEDNISDAELYNHRSKYMLFIELELPNGEYIYKQIVKYDPAYNFQSFEFDKEEINCLKSHTNLPSPELLYGNIPEQIYNLGDFKRGDDIGDNIIVDY